MVTLHHKLNLRVSQRQILTPGLVQMVSVLALNKLELRDMISAEMVENPVLEEMESAVPLLDDVSRREEDRERTEEVAPEAPATEKDPFDEIDFGAYFQEYLDPGYRSRQEWEQVEKPSFENFLSRATTLTDHLMWQLSAMHLRPEVEEAAELIIGNLNEEGYLTASDDELLGVTQSAPEEPAATPQLEAANGEAQTVPEQISAISKPPTPESEKDIATEDSASVVASFNGRRPGSASIAADGTLEVETISAEPQHTAKILHMPSGHPSFDRIALQEALEIVRQMDPVGVACRTLQECLLAQIRHHQHVEEDLDGDEGPNRLVLADCIAILGGHLKELQKKEFKEISKAIARSHEAVLAAVEYIRRLDPRPGLRYNVEEPRLIEPDVAFIKQGDEYLVVMNDDDMPQLRLNPTYKKLLSRDTAEKDVRTYVKERYKSAIQLMKNIEQRKQTILRVCHAIIGRQREFLDLGIDQLKPMMIKDVAEEIGVHPSTVSRAVANKYAHTPQGVFELRYFFSESVNGPEGGGTSLLILKRRVKKLIEEEDSARPLTDEQITRILQSQGIQVTRRTVAKYREDMNIPSTHQRRVKD
ncbi:MAG TPA: RNA polymerase factor sigma-54 [Terriglobales bacterium]|nr:RNA polymerase factor sigma-54 [Terriglobales bacterium]